MPLPQPSYPQPPVPTVEELTGDISLLDITSNIYVKPDADPIGEGSGGNVFKGTYTWEDPSTRERHTMSIVVKLLRGIPAERDTIQRRLNREVATWRSLEHENVAELLGIATLDPELPPGLVSRFVLRHDFLAYIGRRPNEKRQKAQEIARGLEYLHGKNVVHGDLKVNNIMISHDEHAIITDFGISRVLGVKGFTTMCDRNIRFAAPELLPINSGEDDDIVRPTKQSDIFSMGILLLQLFHGPDKDKRRGQPYNHILPHLHNGDFPLLGRIHNGERPLRQNYNGMYDQHWALIERCWASNPLSRPPIAEVLESL